jgi:sulfite reductase (NADPH) flavoprotein alpha-component
VQPTNDPELVQAILGQQGWTGDEIVTSPRGEMPVRDALLSACSITEIDKKLLKAVAEKDPAAAPLALLTSPESKPALEEYLWGRDVLDVLQENPGVRFAPQELVACLKRLNIRLYSISSSLRAHPGQVHLTVATVTYESRGRVRKGVCSTFLADRIDKSTPLPVFISPGKGFRLPDPAEEVPVIMCGPGTGIAPFRAFLQERRMTGAKGKAWLFFGETSESTCYFYKDEFAADLRDGILDKLTTAWSRDQAEKIYVQHRILEEGALFWQWLEQGAIFYVCGDANRMAHDVDKALHQIIEIHGGRSPEEAAAYVTAMKADKRYRRDVY